MAITEPGDESFSPFAVAPTLCVPCSLQNIALGRTDGSVVPSDIGDFLLSDPKYKAIESAGTARTKDRSIFNWSKRTRLSLR